MKKALSFLLSILLLLTVLPSAALVAPVAAEEKPESVVLNVKDFGAVGDGKTDDEAAIWATFECALFDYMAKKIPVTVYFPEGQYGLKNGGLYVYLPRGAGDLTIKGDGADKSTMVYLDEWTNAGSWVALRIYPKIKPESIDQYLHDITIQDLGVYDTDPEKHAWNVDKGDPDTEETHGFNIQHCVRATIKNCKAVDVGDECFDLSHCIDSVMTDNVVIKNRITGKGGGSFSVGDGSKNVTMTNNQVIFNTTEHHDSHYGFAVEALAEPIEDITITDNVVQNIDGWGVSIAAPGGTVDGVLVQNNVLSGCEEGGVRFSGAGHTTGAKILDNCITNTRYGINISGGNKVGTLIENGTIETLSSYAISIGSNNSSDTIVRNVVIRNAERSVVYNAGTNTLLERVWVDGSGMAGGVTDSAVIQYANGGDCTITDSVFLDCRNKKGIQGVKSVINTYVQQPEISGYTSITGVMTIRNCRVNRMITIKSGATVDGLVLIATEDLGTHAIVMSNLTDCTVTNCRITIPSRYGISEAGAADRNTITNNVIIGGSGIKTVGVNTVTDGNRFSTLATTEQFKYYLVDGAATIIAPVDTTLSSYIIPDTIEGCPVTAIDPWAFYGCNSLTDVYYLGSADEWASIAIGESNDVLLWANLTTDYVSYVLGDVDGNGKVNNRDLGLLQLYLNDDDVGGKTFVEIAADMDGNGKLNNRDLGLLQRLLNS